MKCKHCGEEIANESNFCEYCGTRVTNNRKNRIVFWSCFAAIFVAIAVIFMVFFKPNVDVKDEIKDEDGVINVKCSDTLKTAVPSNLRTIRQFCFDGISIDFNMNLKELYSENENVIIKRYEREGNWDDDAAEYYYDGYFYYLINYRTAITFNDTTQCIKWICTKSHSFSTTENIHVGDSWQKVIRAYPNLHFYTDYLHYNHFTRTISPATIAYDENQHVSFIFYLEQFTKEQWEGILSVSNPSGFDTQYNVKDIDYSIYRSICTTIRVDEIETWGL